MFPKVQSKNRIKEIYNSDYSIVKNDQTINYKLNGEKLMYLWCSLNTVLSLIGRVCYFTHSKSKKI